VHSPVDGGPLSVLLDLPSLIPCLRHTSHTVETPLSASFNVSTTCVSLNLDRLIKTS
jgi:hypothetical protein